MSRKATSTSKPAARKRKVGRPRGNRHNSLPKVSAAAHDLFREIAQFRRCSLAKAIEISAEAAMDAMEGRPIRPELFRYE